MSSPNRSIFVSTWNAGNAPPSKLGPLFAGGNKADVIVCGMQESTWGALGEVKVMQDAIQTGLGAVSRKK